MAVNVLPQVRKTFDPLELRELANDIAGNGIIQPPIVAELDAEMMQKHLDFVFEVKGVRLDLSEMKQMPNGMYYYLIAGERRFRAFMLIHDEGCGECRELGRPGNECYRMHVDEEFLLETRICPNPEPVIAKSIQFRENRHIRPPLHEEAYEYEEMFRYFRKQDPSYTLKKFALYVGSGTEKVKRALNFTELPDHIRELTEKGLASMSHVLELKQLIDLPQGGKYLTAKAIEYLASHPKVSHEDFRERVVALLENINQASLFEESPVISKRARRDIVGKQSIPYLVRYKEYLDITERLQRHGLIGKGKIYSGISPGNWVRWIAENIEKLTPGFKLTKAQRRALARLSFERPARKAVPVH